MNESASSHPQKQPIQWCLIAVVWVALYVLISSFVQAPPRNTKPEKGKEKVILDHADRLDYNAEWMPNVQRLSGNVQLRHLEWIMRCDSAYLNKESNQFEAFGNVSIQEGDSISIDAHYLHYDGNIRYARLRDAVMLSNNTATLYTDSLDYDRAAGLGSYFDGGTIVDSLNTLTSEYGEYMPSTNEAIFRNDVVLENPDFTLYSDFLLYNTDTKIAVYDVPTRIVSDSGHIESTRGVYDTDRELGILLDRSIVYSKRGNIVGDSLLYDKPNRQAEAFGNMVLVDTTKQAILKGEYGYYDEEKEYAFATHHASLTDYSRPDTLYLGADTIELITQPYDLSRLTPKSQKDSTAVASPQKEEKVRVTRAFYNTRLYRKDLQAVADSMHYFSVDSTLRLYKKPIVWKDSSQLRGDESILQFADDTLQYALFYPNANLMQQLKEKDKFNQLKSDSITIFFADSAVQEVHAVGNADMVYYALQESLQRYFGVGRVSAPSVICYFQGDSIRKAIWQGAAKGAFHPIEKVSSEVSQIAGLQWSEEVRPSDPEDIFVAVIDSMGNPQPYQSPGLEVLARYSGRIASQKAYALLEANLKMLEEKAQDTLVQKEDQPQDKPTPQETMQKDPPEALRYIHRYPPLDVIKDPWTESYQSLTTLWHSFSSSTINEPDDSITHPYIGRPSEMP